MMKMFAAVFLFALLLVACAFADNPHNVPRGPVIVAEVEFLSQTTALPTTTLFTPATDGLYRVSFYTEATPNPSGCSPTPVVSWTDENGLQPNSGQFNRSDSTVRAQGGTPISIAVPNNCGPTVVMQQFNLYVVVEQL